MTIFASAAVNLEFLLPVWSYSIPCVSVGLVDLENGGIAVDIVSLGGIEAEIRWGYFYPLPHLQSTYVKKTCNMQQQG